MTECSTCHGAVVGSDDTTIVDRSRHVDGVIDVAVPTSCTACHGGAKDAAPTPGERGAGAHRAHLDGLRAAAVPCATCHIVPKDVLAAGHIDTSRPGEVTFSGLALANGASPLFSTAQATCSGTPCHGATLPDGNDSGGTNTVPNWNTVDGSQVACGTCHAVPPPAPHPYFDLNPVCSACHKDIAPDNRTFTRPDLHVDGKVTFEIEP
jgi:predicted CxxxxCH...CXXCH cytochrome family protein